MIVGVYVDDILAGESKEECSLLHVSLNKKFPTNSLGKCMWYTGCFIERDWVLGTLIIHQETYVESMMKRFDVQTTPPIPASPGADLGPRG